MVRRSEIQPRLACTRRPPDSRLSILAALNIRVKKDELDLVGNVTAERVRVNGGDYAGEVGVYHHLHCLNNLRMVVHWDYYESRLPKYDPKNNPFAKTHSGMF